MNASRELMEAPGHGPSMIFEPQVTQPSARTTQFGAGEFLRILRRRKYLIASTVAVVLALTLLSLSWTTPLYSTSAVLMVEPQDQTVASAGAAAAALPTAPDEELRIETKLGLLQSRALARQVAEKLDLRDDPEFAPPPVEEPGLVERALSIFLPSKAAPIVPTTQQEKAAAANEEMEAVTDRLLSRMWVERLARSNLIQVSVSSWDPAKAALIANSVVETHINAQRDEDRKSRTQEIAQLTGRVTKLREDLRAADRAVADYRRLHGLFSAQPDGLNQAQMAQLTGALTQARAQRAQSGSRAALFAGADAAYATSPLLNDLRNQESQLTKRRAELSTTYGRNHPDVRNTMAQLRDIRARIAEEVVRVGVGLSKEAAVSRAEEGQMSQDIGALRSRTFSEIAATPTLLDLQRDADTSQALYVSLLSRLKDLSGKGAQQHPDASIVSRAPVPVSPSYPAPQRTLGIAFLGSLALAFLLAIALEAKDNKLRTGEQVERWLAIPALSMVPEAPPPVGLPLYELIREQPRSSYSEAIRSLLVELDAQRPPIGSHVILVTSPTGREGKRTIATSLAAAAATMGRATVVVDLDLRKPGANRQADASAAAGDTVAYLAGRAEIEDILTFDEAIAPFATIDVRKAARDPGALIASPRLKLLINHLRERFELVILLVAPILPVRDAKVIEKLADSTLLVLRWGDTTLQAARIAITILGGRVGGAVLNRVDYRKHRFHGSGDAIHHYSSYARYYSEGPPSLEGPSGPWTRLLGN